MSEENGLILGIWWGVFESKCSKELHLWTSLLLETTRLASLFQAEAYTHLGISGTQLSTRGPCPY